MPTYEELVALAMERAATKVDTWIPEKIGDRIAGKVVEVGTITTKFGQYYTTTLETFSDYVENGETKRGDGKLVRTAWMGAVLQATYLRLRPGPDDIVAQHYQDDVSPQNGMNDYALIVASVFDANTGKAKLPVLDIEIPTTEQMTNADVRTGELPTPGLDPLAPVPGEEPL